MSMNFDLGDLRAFIAVAELASFRAAAETIHLSQPALSRRIDKLEDALDQCEDVGNVLQSIALKNA